MERIMQKEKWIKGLKILIAAMLIVPLLIHLLSPSVNSAISADGILSYWGNCITMFPTVAVAVVAVWQSKLANDLAQKANQEAEESARNAIQATEISQRLLELEEKQQELALQPSFAVTGWRAPIKSFENVRNHSECLNIRVGEYSDGEAWGMELDLLNTSSVFERVHFSKAVNSDGETFDYGLIDAKETGWIKLSPLKTKKIYLYADKGFWEKQQGKKYCFEFNVKNHLDTAYIETFELIILAMNAMSTPREDEAHLCAEVQNYSICKADALTASRNRKVDRGVGG